MTTGPGTGRVSTSETVRALLAAVQHREPAPPEHTIEVTTTTIRPAGEKAYRVHNWTITIRGTDADECDRVARRLDDGLAAKFAGELDNGDDLAAKLAASVDAQEGSGRGR